MLDVTIRFVFGDSAFFRFPPPDRPALVYARLTSNYTEKKLFIFISVCRNKFLHTETFSFAIVKH